MPGLKSASNDHGVPAVVGIKGCVFEFGGDEHGILRKEDGGEVPLDVGDKRRSLFPATATQRSPYDQYIVLKDNKVVFIGRYWGRVQ